MKLLHNEIIYSGSTKQAKLPPVWHACIWWYHWMVVNNISIFSSLHLSGFLPRLWVFIASHGQGSFQLHLRNRRLRYAIAQSKILNPMDYSIISTNQNLIMMYTKDTFFKFLDILWPLRAMRKFYMYSG